MKGWINKLDEFPTTISARSPNGGREDYDDDAV
jgi:hypothetical protein